MTDAMFLTDFDTPPAVGDVVTLDGEEGRHAAVVRRIAVEEIVLLADGNGRGIRGTVERADRSGLAVRVDELIEVPEPDRRIVVVQALAKGDRSELAVEMLTELGVWEVVPWEASRSIVKWAPDRVERALRRWRAIAREAAKQSRRFRVPVVSFPATTTQLVARIPTADLVLVLHEDATVPVPADLPSSGEILVIVGPEGGIAPSELAAFTEAGARAVRISDGVLRTSTAGAVAVGQLYALGAPR
ncbi:16S rRNA (uracil(1498)-N(3))-methyltransferase [Propionicicella superfundia]|uniref:16S rRNA (uracil(1498)-N(3))-methyltransferase n=1 Tax=Propionicicella superfundia TaxID=348582 RepID=UPI0003FD1AB8|nr:16S rRNA (uracil(1498)-N(3))-methyltransferase [Propionicicella superfundia]